MTAAPTDGTARIDADACRRRQSKAGLMVIHWRLAAAGMLAAGAVLTLPAILAAGAAPGALDLPAATAGHIRAAFELAHESGRLEEVTTPTRTAALPGSASSYAFLVTVKKQPVRFNPCQDIRYRVNLGPYSDKVLPSLREALRRLSVASGLNFVAVGGSSYIPWGPEANPPGNADLVIAIASSASAPVLEGTVIGMGGVYWDDRTGRVTLGQVVLDSAWVKKARPGFASRGATLGGLLVHELGHAVGLGHVRATDQVMFPVLTSYSANDYQRGDRAGLAKVGAKAGCLPS